MCDDLGYPEKMEEIKEWYDGYRFGKEEIYNPWSVLSYFFFDRAPAAYWSNTSGNGIILELLGKTDDKAMEGLQSLLTGSSVSKPIKETVVYADISKDKENVYSVMALSGYLKAVKNSKGEYDLTIPNKEVSIVYGEMIESYLSEMSESGNSALDFCNALRDGKPDEARKELDLLLEGLSLTSIPNNEERLKASNPYKWFLLGLLSWNRKHYETEEERKGGNGIADIRMKCVSGEFPNIVLELKATSDPSKNLKRLASYAIRQAERKKYHKGMSGETYIYGISFYKKDSIVKMKIAEPGS
jgi:hypothetical protein